MLTCVARRRVERNGRSANVNLSGEEAMARRPESRWSKNDFREAVKTLKSRLSQLWNTALEAFRLEAERKKEN